VTVRRVDVVEGVPFAPDPDIAALTRAAADRLRRQLRPRVPFLVDEPGRLTVRNIVGTVRLNDSTVLQVEPKVGGSEDWVRAVLDLLVGSDRVDLAGERLAGLAAPHRNLLDVMAGIYATRLQKALRRDGPMLTLERRNAQLALLKGKLHTSAYLRHAAWKPHRFPIEYDELTADNDFTRAMSFVARLLGNATLSSRIRGSLFESAVALRPGAAEHSGVDPTVVTRTFPQQWVIYRPAWSIAMAILSRSSLLGASGHHHGVEIVVEAWPLHERLLERALDAAATAATASGRNLEAPLKYSRPLLIDPSSGKPARSVEPDGLLIEHGSVLATFEAKYSAPSIGQEFPAREHVFQALSTAAAFDSPLAVLVYPARFDATWWDVTGFGGTPRKLAAIGLGLFEYRRGVGDVERGEWLLRLLDNLP
jgi:hypothetical protein